MAAAAAHLASAATPHFCSYHAQKESQSQAAEKLAKDLAFFFSGDYLSACDLNTALGRLIPAVIRGQIKPRVARTVAYMLQTLLQSTRLAQHEYINAFGTDAWRDAVHTSVNSNHDHLFPPDPNDPENESEDDPEDESEPESDALDPDTVQPAPSTQPPPPPQHPPATPPPSRPSPADTEAALAAARSIFPPRPNNTTPPAPPPQPPTPPRDPFELRFPHTSLRVDGKPW